MDERRHAILKVFVLNSSNDEATEIKAAASWYRSPDPLKAASEA